MFVVLLTHERPAPEMHDLVTAHAAFIDRQIAAGHVMAAGPRVPFVGGVLLATAKDREAIEELVRQDPYVVQGFADYQIVEFTPGKRDPRFAQLLA